MRTSRSNHSTLLPLAITLVALASAAHAANPPYFNPGPFVIPEPGFGIPTPAEVTGKEYTDFLDIDASGLFLSPGQDVTWDGFGGTANSFLYRIPGVNQVEVDAQAAQFDALFQEVIRNQSAMINSVTGDPIDPLMSHSITGAVATWATPGQIAAMGVSDLNSIEVWGPELADDANFFSVFGDPLGISVWSWDDSTLTASAFITQSQIAAVIGRPELFDQIDLDGLMLFGEEVLFSIRPIPGAFDGGEIWYTPNFTLPGSGVFLVHGGIVWDTANDVTALYGAENIDGIEAVSTPEPSSVLLLGLGGLGLLAACRRRARREA